MIKNYSIALTIVLLLLQSCDADKYFSYSLNPQQQSDSTSIIGKVVRYDNNYAIAGALIQIGYNRTTTDTQGLFRVGIQYSSDDDRNSVSPIIIKADKYIDYYGSTLILPVPQKFQFKMIWRPPIVADAAFLFNPEEGVEKVIQAKIRDFEGVGDIDSVYTFFKFAPMRDASGLIIRESEIIYINLLKVCEVDSQTAIYQSDKFDRDIQHPRGWIPYLIFAIDMNGYREVGIFKYFLQTPDTLIYPVEW